MFFIKNRLVKILTVLTVLLLFFSFGLFLSDITSDKKVESVVIDYEPVHSLSSSDNLYYGTDNYVDGDYYIIEGDTNFIPLDFASFSSWSTFIFAEIIGSDVEGALSYCWYLNYYIDSFEIENDILIFVLDINSEDYTVLAYDGFSFDLSLFVDDSVTIEIGVPYDGTVLNSLNEAITYSFDKQIVYSDFCTFYFNSAVDSDGGQYAIPLESAYELGYLTTQGTGIVEVVTSVFPLGLGILNAISSYFTVLFFNNGSLSNFAIFSFVLVGISLVMGLTYVIYNYVKRKR